MDDDFEYSEATCSICNSYLHWALCWHCGGEGEFDDYEDDAINFGPGQSFTPCYICDGSGVIEWCPQSSKHPECVIVAALDGE